MEELGDVGDRLGGRERVEATIASLVIPIIKMEISVSMAAHELPEPSWISHEMRDRRMSR